MKGTWIWTVQSLTDHAASVAVSNDGVNFVPCRGEGFTGIRYRLRAAWLVFTGKADAVVWPDGQ